MMRSLHRTRFAIPACTLVESTETEKTYRAHRNWMLTRTKASCTSPASSLEQLSSYTHSMQHCSSLHPLEKRHSAPYSLRYSQVKPIPILQQAFSPLGCQIFWKSLTLSASCWARVRAGRNPLDSAVGSREVGNVN